ncbi:MAG: lipoyl(octanoyl) transferase LipB [Chloroflexales bacterium]|nr:lipoyl(octanoyl) transferase LipB [Chloroflexales bacterium]
MDSVSITTLTCRVIDAGCIEYQSAWDWQRRLVAKRSAGQCPDTLLLLEHPPTITLGRAAKREHVLIDAAELARRGVTLVESDRGGDVTYHAPGQVVGYPIIKLSRYGGDLGRYVRNLEEIVIQVLTTYGIAAGRIPGLTGVWVEESETASSEFDLLAANIRRPNQAKIAAIGVKLSASGVTAHGFALNVDPDLRGFAQIVPCGIRDRSVTSMAQILGAAPSRAEVIERVITSYRDVFGVDLQQSDSMHR